MRGEVDVLSKKRKQILNSLSENPFQSEADMVAICGWSRSPLHRQLTSMESDGWIAHVKHSLEGRNSTRRYYLTDKGVALLSDISGDESDSRVMDRPGTTEKGLTTYHTLIDNLAGVYRSAGAVARCLSVRALRIHLFSAGPLDAVIRILRPPYSVGVMVYRPALSTAYFEKKARYYANAGPERPSCLLVVSPDYMADHAVARLVTLNYQGVTVIAPLDRAGNPDARVWREPAWYEERLWTMRDILNRVPEKVSRKFKPQVKSFHHSAPPRSGWKPAIVLTYRGRGALRVIADWPLANREFIATLSDLTESSFQKIERTLRKQGLVRRVPVAEEEEGLVLTDKGIVYVCRAARASHEIGKDQWSAEDVEDGKFRGGNLKKLAHDISHTKMVHEVVRRFKAGAKVVRARGIRITPAHKVERYFRPGTQRSTRSVKPDAVIDLVKDGRRYALLLEAERGAMTYKYMQNRLQHYQAYFREERSKHDDPVPPLIAIVLEDAGAEANFSRAQVDAGLTHLPAVLTNMGELARSPAGPFDPVWRWAGGFGQRKYLHELTV